MPKLEIDVTDDGKIGTLPEPLQKFLDAKISEGYGKGAAKAAEEARTSQKALETEIATLKKGGLDPVERERLKSLEGDLSKLQEEIATRDRNFEQAQKIRDERHAKELHDRDAKLTAAQAEIDKRHKRIGELVGKEIRAAALEAGAREESLDELEQLLGPRVGLDDDLQVFVTDAKQSGKPLLGADQKPVTLEGFVAEYLNARPHHKAAPSGRGGRAAGGRSLSGAGATNGVPDGSDAKATWGVVNTGRAS